MAYDSVKKLIQTAKDKLSDVQIFTCGRMKEFLFNKQEIICEDFYIVPADIKLLADKNNQSVAYTDDKQIVINTENDFLAEVPRQKKFELILGLLMHETGHKLFTNFMALYIYVTNMERGVFFPKIPVVPTEYQENLEELSACMEKYPKFICNIAKDMLNILEDGREETLCLRYCKKYRMLHEGLRYLRVKAFMSTRTIDEIMDDKKLDIEVILTLILHYARFGEIKGYIPSKKYARIECVQFMKNCAPFIDEAIYSQTSTKMQNDVNIILVLLWPYIKELIPDDDDKDKSDDKSKSDDNDKSKDNSESKDNDDSKDNSKSSDENESGGNNQDNSDGSSDEELAEKAAQMLKKILDEGNINDLTESNQSGNGTESTKMVSALKGAAGKEPDLHNGMDPETLKNPERIPDSEGEALDTGSGGTLEKDDALLGGNNRNIELGKIINSVAKEVVDKKLEANLLEDLNDFDTTVKYNNIHKGIKGKIHRYEVTSSNIDQYNCIAPEILKISKETARQTKRFFEDSPEDVFVKNKYCGTKFLPETIARANYKNFGKEIKASDSPDMSVAILVDESGSMGGSRCEYAKATALCLYLYARELELPVAVYGHNTAYYDADIYAYADFDKVSKDDAYRIMNISSGGANRDGYALQYVMERMKLQPSNKKLLFIVSDGQPSSYNYSGEAAEKDIKGIVSKAMKNDIEIIAAAIGEDKERIKRIYGENRFLDVTNLDELPKTLTKIVKRNII